jgi:predicted negative regulator of RcsB-dependent stress response
VGFFILVARTGANQQTHLNKNRRATVAAHLTEEEQLENLKQWWKDYGTTVVVAVVVGLGGFFGWNQYQSYQQGKASEASVVYEKFATAVTAQEDELSAEQSAELKQLAQAVIAQDESSLYADFAELYLAKLAVQQKDYASAKTSLEKVFKRGTNDSMRDLARLRLARVHAAAGEIDQAISLLSAPVLPAYTAAYAEAKGDVLLGQERLAEARTAYQAALQALGANQPQRRNLVQLKIDNTRTSADEPEILPQPGVSPHSAETSPHTPPPVAAEGN